MTAGHWRTKQIDQGGGTKSREGASKFSKVRSTGAHSESQAPATEIRKMSPGTRVEEMASGAQSFKNCQISPALVLARSVSSGRFAPASRRNPLFRSDAVCQLPQCCCFQEYNLMMLLPPRCSKLQLLAGNRQQLARCILPAIGSRIFHDLDFNWPARFLEGHGGAILTE